MRPESQRSGDAPWPGSKIVPGGHLAVLQALGDSARMEQSVQDCAEQSTQGERKPESHGFRDCRSTIAVSGPYTRDGSRMTSSMTALTIVVTVPGHDGPHVRRQAGGTADSGPCRTAAWKASEALARAVPRPGSPYSRMSSASIRAWFNVFICSILAAVLRREVASPLRRFLTRVSTSSSRSLTRSYSSIL